MKKATALASALLLVGLAFPAPAAEPAPLPESWFGATRPGSWVKYEQTATDAEGRTRNSEVTLSRLGGDGGETWIEVRVVPKKGTRFEPKTVGHKDRPTTAKVLLKGGFEVEKNALDFSKNAERMVLQEDGRDATEYPVGATGVVAPGFVTLVDYGANAAPLGACAHEGRSGEAYRIEGPFDAKVEDPQRPWADARTKGTTGTEVCLGASVPFGRLHERTVVKDESGKLRETIETRFLESGAGATSAIRGPVRKWVEGSTMEAAPLTR